MKRIYAFTLENDDYLSDKFRYNLRLIAFLLYDRIYTYYGDECSVLILNDKIKSNNIYEGHLGKGYYFEYNEYNEKYCNYEPLIINNKTFALTIDDQFMSDDIICSLMDEIIVEISLISRVKYDYSFRSITYLSKNIDDEKNRKKAILELRDMVNGNIQKKKNELVRKKTMNISMFGRKIGLF